MCPGNFNRTHSPSGPHPPMSARYHIAIAHDTLDALRFAHQTYNPGTPRRLILVPRDAVRSPLFFGHYCPPEYVGLSGLFQYDAEELAIRRPDTDPPLYVVFSSQQEMNLPCAGLLDRLRTRLAGWSSAAIVLTYRHLADDLPPLQSGDEIICLWDLRIPPSPANLETIETLRSRAAAGSARFHGVRLTCPAQLPAKEVKDRLQFLRTLAETDLPEPAKV